MKNVKNGLNLALESGLSLHYHYIYNYIINAKISSSQ